MNTGAALNARLDELADVVMALPHGVYLSRIEPPVSGTIGEHVRHALDHVAALLASDGIDPVSYDRRDRGTAVETDTAAALSQILSLKAGVSALRRRSMAEPIAVRTQLTTGGAETTAWSTLERELTFVISHTIHHQALIAMLLAWHGIDVAPRFGLAPSTPRAS